MRLAYVLGWKRENGTKIHETAEGLERHKAMVLRYEQETGPLKPAYRGIIDRKYAKVAKKLAEREVGRAKSKGRADTEKRRAVYAKRLHKWIDGDGSKLPSTPAGIKRHKVLVAWYEKIYGPSSDLDREARARTYQAILASIEREKTRREWQAQRSKEIDAEKKRGDAKQRAKNRAAKKKRDAARAKAGEAQDRRRRQWRASYYRSRIRLAKQRIATSEKDVMSPAELHSFRESSAYFGLVKARDRAKQLLVIFRKNLAVYKTKLADLQL